MAAGKKNSTLVLKVNLHCRHCHKKIRNVICKLQLEREQIETISYDNKNQTVTISGPFDPESVSNKLKCMAGSVIKNVQIKEEPKKPKTVDQATQTGVHFEEDVINAEKKKKHKQQLKQTERGDALKQPVETDDDPEAEASRQPVKVARLVPAIPYFWQSSPLTPAGGPICACGRPCFGGHQGGCMYCSYPLNSGGVGYGVPHYPVPHKTVQFFCEDDQPTGCAVM